MEYILLNIFWMVCVFLKLLFFNFYTNINTPPFRWKTHKKTVQAIFASVMILNSLLGLISIGVLWIVIWTILEVLLFADTLYMRYYKSPLTVSVIIHQIKLIKGIKESVFGVVLKKDFMYLIDLPFVALFYILWIRIEVDMKFKLVFGFLCLTTGVLWFFSIYHISNRKPYFWNKKRIARDLGILYYHLEDLIRYISNRLKRTKPLTAEDKDRIHKAAWVRSENEYSHRAKDKNVIVIQMESMQDFLINRTIDGNEITPNLNKLMKENIRFENMYYQTSVGNTSDAELIFNNSLFPLADKPACYECQKNSFESIGHALKKKGYSNYGFHGNQASFWNRHLIYPLYGYDSFIDNSMLENDEFIFPGLSDRSFFRQIVDFLKGKSADGKYFAFLITLSLHHPYDYFENYNFAVGSYERNFIGKYLKGAHYSDECIGKFVEDLKSNGMYEDSLIVMYGDHAGIPRQYRQELMNFMSVENNDFNWIKLQKVAAFLHLPGQSESKNVKKVVGQIDILPTISNLADIDIPCAMGKDMLEDTTSGGMVTRDKIVVTDHFVSFPNRGYAYDTQTGEELSISSEMKSEIKALTEKLEISDLILEKDALKKIISI